MTTRAFLSKSYLRFFLATTIIAMATPIVTADTGAKPYDLDDPSEPWRTSRSGISKRVMPPYTPLVRKDKQVQCWGRQYTLDGLFPSAISSQGQQILARPIALMLKIDGRWITAKANSVDFTRIAEDHIDFESTATVDQVNIGAKSWIEYDGLIRIDLALESEQAATIEALRLLFPFNPQASIFHHTEVRWGPHIYRRSPDKPGQSVTYPWQPLVWVGNHDLGFTVVTETRNGWKNTKDPINIEKTDDVLELSLDIIAQPTKLSNRLQYSFGLMATPCKPMPKDRWDIRIGTLPRSNVSHTNHNNSWQPLYSYPQPADCVKAAESLKRSHKRGARVCYYITTSATSLESKVNQRNHADWVMSKVILDGPEWKVGSGLIGADACCPASGFSDFLTWGIEQLMDHVDIDGIYIDNPGPYFCENTRHGCGAGGKKTYPFFALRDLHKRIYTIVKTRKPNGLVWEHTSESFNPLQLAWVDIYSDGEHIREAKRYPREKLEKLFDRTYMEITGTGHQVGAVPSYLTSIGARSDGDWSHWILARVLPWGQMVWNCHGWLDGSPAMATAQARTNFGLEKEPATFYRPHELPNWFSLKPKEVIACLWQRERDKAVLAVLANWDDKPVLARINYPLVKAKLGPVVFSDPTSGVNIPEEHMMISIPVNSFRMVQIVPKAKQK